MPDFEVANSEFDRQATILEQLVATIEVSAHQDGITKHVIEGAELPMISPGGQNTMAAAAVVLLAAHFEEYVRQQVEEYAEEMILEYAHLTDEFRSQLIDAYWRAGSDQLGRIRPRVDPLWASNAGPMLQGLLGYPIQEDMALFNPSIVSHHENNMRWETITDLTGRIGVKNLSGLMFKSGALRNALAGPGKSNFPVILRKRLGEFYALRNGIVHSISQNNGIGSNTFAAWAEFFRIFSAALAQALGESFETFLGEVAKRKAALVPPP